MMKKTFTTLIEITLLIGLVLMTGCQPVIKLVNTAVISTPTAQIVTQSATDNSYPSSPEEVIRAFLLSYPVDKIYAVQYLSPAYVSSLDEQSVLKLMPYSGEITGFIIESGSTSAESEKSQILTNVAFQDNSSEILFDLIIVDGRWSINKITPK
jgi:hypothetical protein